MKSNWSEGVPWWLPLASWGFWLGVLAMVAALFLQMLAAHRAEAAAGAHEWQLQVDMCVRLSKEPRPWWWECQARATTHDGDLLAPATPNDTPRH